MKIFWKKIQPPFSVLFNFYQWKNFFFLHPFDDLKLKRRWLRQTKFFLWKALFFLFVACVCAKQFCLLLFCINILMRMRWKWPDAKLKIENRSQINIGMKVIFRFYLTKLFLSLAHPSVLDTELQNLFQALMYIGA